jgi:hypothetical protein
MPKLKQPITLQDQVVQCVVNMTCEACVSWIRKLGDAEEIGSEAHLKATQNVMTDCDKLHDHLASFPIGIKKHIAPLILKEVVAIITEYDETSYKLKRASWYREEDHNILCAKMLRAVPLNCITEYENKYLEYGCEEKLIIQALHSLPNLTMLALSPQIGIDNSALLATNIHHLTQLQHFHYQYDCIDRVVEQLALHCTQLKTINVRYSVEVTDASVQHLMNLRKLEYVDLTYTSISFHSYGVLLSELPSISNIFMMPPMSPVYDRFLKEKLYTSISFQAYGSLLSELPRLCNIVMMSPKCDVFGNISKEKLNTITQYTGYIRNINILTKKCPNITRAVVYSRNEDLTNLTALTRLVNLKIKEGNYEICNLNAVLIGMGDRLSELCLQDVRSVNMADVVHSCSSLKSLVLKRCSFVPLTESAILDTDLPQYRSLIQLKLIENDCHQNDFRLLRHYVNLEVFECTGLDIVTDDFLEDAIRQGAFRNIVRFWVEDTNTTLTMRTVELLLQHCDRLREIGHLTSWSRLPLSEYSDFIKRTRIMNIDLLID